ncbi:MAG: hypothetical protein LBT52_03975 [Clostridiales Family XIII bacterium]|jgi:hypothetical protein|nr:hypothetical protein [Clostridiales Family XIII bacterium]
MANKNRRTKARRVKEYKEEQHKKVVAKPIYKRPWIWIALAVLVLGIVVPSAYQHNKQVQEEAKITAAETKEQNEAEPLVWESIQTPLADLGISESAIIDKSFEAFRSITGGAIDNALVTITTDVRTLVAQATFASTTDTEDKDWICTLVTDETGQHTYWSYFAQGGTNATQAAVQGADGSITMAPIYDWRTDAPVTGTETPATGSAVETPDDESASGSATETPGEDDAAEDASSEGDAASDEATGNQ